MTDSQVENGQRSLEGLRHLDLSQRLASDGALWNGFQAAEVETHTLDIAHQVPDGEVCFTRLSIVSHTGTHVDAARHFFPSGRTIEEYELDRFVRPAIAVDARREGPVPLTRAELEREAPDLRPGDALLIYFGYAERFGDPDYYDHPYLSVEATEYALEREAGLVGVDTLTPDLPAMRRPESGYDFPVHHSLLSADVLIIENLGPNLAQLLGRRFLLVAAPLRIVGGDASPVVPVALLDDKGADQI
jgi:arylformamidase